MSEAALDRTESWYGLDLHVHTSASADYADREDTLLSVLEDAAAQGLALIALTDHHSVAGYERLRQERSSLQRRAQRNRLKPDEAQRLAQLQRLLATVTVLPGFEYTSAEQLSLLAIYPPSTDPDEIKATLWQLNVPHGQEAAGLVTLPDALPAVDAAVEMAESGALVLLTHVVPADGGGWAVLTRDRRGGSPQPLPEGLRVHAYELDPYARISGTDQAEAGPAGMLLLRGSNAHSAGLSLSPADGRTVGACSSRVLLEDVSFPALRACLLSGDQSRIQLSAPLAAPAGDDRSVTALLPDAAAAAELWRDLAALANHGGGTLILQASAGVLDVEAAFAALLQAAAAIDPQPHLQRSAEGSDSMLQVTVSAVAPPPYVTRDGAVLLRRGGRSIPADRAELLQLCRAGLAAGAPSLLDTGDDVDLPRSGVEIIAAQRRAGNWLYEVRDLRTTAGVTRDRAEGLWAYAIERHELLRDGRVDLRDDVRWHGLRGLWRAYRQGARPKYDLVTRDVNGVIEHIFYGVSDWGLSRPWLDLVSSAEVPAEDDSRALTADVPAAAVETAAAPVQQPDAAVVQAAGPTFAAPPIAAGREALNGWGAQRARWRGRGGLERVVRLESGQVRFDLLMQERDNEPPRSFRQVALERLSEAWLRLIRVEPPTTGIEVAEYLVTETGEACFRFRNMRSGDVSANPWRLSQIDAGTVREYAARTYLLDRTLNEGNIRWLGNIGYLRPMRSQVDLVLIDEFGVRRIFYAARRDELRADWRELLTVYGEYESTADV